MTAAALLRELTSQARRLARLGPLGGASVVSMANSLAVGIAYGRLAGPAAYGTFQIALASTVVAGVIGLSGSTTAASRAAAQGRLAAWPLFRARLPLCLVAGAGLGTVGFVVAALGNPGLGFALVAGAMTLPLFIGGDVYAAQLLGLRRYEAYFRFQVVLQGSTAVVVTLAVAAFPSAPWVAMLGFGSVNAALNAAGLARARHETSVAEDDFRYARRYTGVAALAALQARLDVLITGSVLGAYEAGLVAVARVFPMIARRLLEIVQVAFFVDLAALSPGHSAGYLRRWRLRALALVVALSAGGIIAAPFLVPALYGDSFSDSVPVAQLLLVAAAITGVGFLEEIMLKAQAALRQVMLIRVVVPTVMFASLPPLVVLFGIIGVGISAVLGAVVSAPLAITFARRHFATRSAS